MDESNATAKAFDLENTPFINVTFPIQGDKLSADHAFALYSAITKVLPDLHGTSWLAVEMISGIPWDKGMIALPRKGATLHLRIPADKFAFVLPLAGKRLEIEGHTLRVGIPNARPLTPASSVYARIVTIKNHTEPETFLEAAKQKLKQHGINATLELPRDGRTRTRRIVTIHDKKVVGFSLVAHGLSDDDSIKLQTIGLGGRRAMGCGIFNPIVRRVDNEENAQ
jgi:CRISPR-associated endonuclease/helicase Cas3